MEKENAKELVNRIYDEIITHIDQAEKVNESEIIDFLHELAHSLITSHFDNSSTCLNFRTSFENEYRQLAESSIDSYKSSNDIIAKLTVEHQSAFEQMNINGEIDIDAYVERFNAIQTDMSSEVTRATDTISGLFSRIQELETLAAVDPLTKIYNRRSLDSYLEMMLQSGMDRHLEMHLMMIDLDDFKQINDVHGHQAGDKVLIFIANLLRKTLRDGDKVFRYGGEEFVIILNRISEMGCMNVGHRLLALSRSSKLISKNEQITVTFSIGATAYVAGDTIHTIIQRADNALYQAKAAGKNQLKVLH
jgi:diguanylate cyclase (GGDEF)-like protein